MSDDHDHELSTVDLEGRPSAGLRRRLYIIIFEADTPAGRLFDIVLLWTILISILAVILESDKSISQAMQPFMTYLEWTVTAFFTLEYVLRLYVSKKPQRYAFSFFGLVDLLATLPTYIAFVLPSTKFLLVIRVLRLLRVFRILKLVRYTKASKVLGEALLASRYKVFIFLGVVLSLVLILGTCMYIVEGDQIGFSSIPKSMYWAIVTMTTVGYGDVVPQTILGKLVASMMMLIGYAIIAVPTGIVTTELVSANKASTLNCQRCKESLVDGSNYCHKCGSQT